MSQQVSNVFITEFVARFEALYQGAALLNGTTMEMDNIVGENWKVPTIAPIVLQERTQSQTPVISLDPAQAFITGTLQDFASNIGIDKLDRLKTNVNVQESYAKDLAMAAGRREDQQKIDIWEASATSNVIPNGATNLTLAKLRQASAFLNKEEVEQMDRHIVVTESQLESLLGDPTVTSADFNTIRALMTGELNTFVGFRFYIMGSSRAAREGGLPVNANIRTCFAWQKRSTWMGYGKRPSIEIFEDKPNITTLIQLTMSSNAVEVLPEGVVKIDCDET